MKTEKEVRIRIAQIKQENEHLLSGSLATIQINAPRALGQIACCKMLETLYWVLGENFHHEWPKKESNT
jgi:hypothetical protein